LGKVDDNISDGEPISEVEPASDDEDGEALFDKDDINTFFADDVGYVDSCLEQE
jgi:hypothetical protein